MKAFLETILQLYHFLSNPAFRYEICKKLFTKTLKFRSFFVKKIRIFFTGFVLLHQISRAVKITRTALFSRKIRPSREDPSNCLQKY